uniref:Uncharacterized protein n=1 Tax=Amphora coffeiformis TaxID=265554 RepID=A0A7S3P5P4_9STRA
MAADEAKTFGLQAATEAVDVTVPASTMSLQGWVQKYHPAVQALQQQKQQQQQQRQQHHETDTTTTTTTTPPSPAAAAAMQIPQSTEESLFSPSSHLSPVVGRASIERLSHYRPTRRPPSSSASASARHSDVSMDLSMGSFVSFSSPTSRTG